MYVWVCTVPVDIGVRSTPGIHTVEVIIKCRFCHHSMVCSSTSLPYLQNALKMLEGVSYFINGMPQLKQIIAV